MTGPSGFSVPVTVQVPAAMYGLLQAVGRRHGVSVSVLLVEAARRGLVAGKPVQKVKRARVRAVRFPVTDEQRAQIVVLHGRGLNDSQIAAELGLSARTVQRERSVRLGLPPVVVGRPKKVRS